MPKIAAVVGTDAVAEAMRQIGPDVVAAYPITPQTAIVETFAQMVADGKVRTKMINVESEHSAMSACVGAAASGARVMTCTSSQGLALMFELLYIASGLRLPIVMPNVNRALSAPINIHCDHSDSMGARDSGWIQLYCENAQEAYDNTLQAIRIAEHPDIQLPVMVNFDGFIISHSIDRVEFIDDHQAKSFVGPFQPAYSLLDWENPITVGGFDTLYGYYFEFKQAQEQAMLQVPAVVKSVGAEYGQLSGRPYGTLEKFMMEDAEIVVIATGSATGTIKSVIRELRDRGVPVGLIKIRMFRPFPATEIVEALSKVKVAAVFDRSDTFAGGMGGPIFIETRSSLYEAQHKPPLVNFVYGLGGRDLSPELIRQAFKKLEGISQVQKADRPVEYLGLKE